MYKIHIGDRRYTTWTFLNVVTFAPVELPVTHPAELKLLSNDIVNVTDGIVSLEFSSVRAMENIPGVLDLKSGKTYGRENGTAGRLLYKVVPDDMRLPVFLVPYEQKQMGFSKVFVNLYVTFRFVLWEGKHPLGKLTSTIGSVDTLPTFYEYQLYCRSLNASIQRFNKDASKGVKMLSGGDGLDGILQTHSEIEDRRTAEWNVFTIDPESSVDFDDGFSIRENENGVVLSIYIANVTILLDAMNLWDSFSRRVSTIYLPDRKRPMLPTILSDNLCSLQEKVTRFALAMDIRLDKDTYEIVDISYKNCAVRVTKNYRYEEASLLVHTDYTLLNAVTIQLAKRYKYIQHIKNSHDVVCYLMTLMNYKCAQNLLGHKNGLFRSSVLKNDAAQVVPPSLDENVEKFIKIWYSSGGRYIDAATLGEDYSAIRHELIDMDAYVHITSPIRRLVDLLNMIKFQENNHLIVLSDNASQFYKEWTSETELEYINTTMRSIKKVQNDCSMLEFYTNNLDTLDEWYDGVMFDKLLRNDGSFQYVVYLSKLKLTLRINLHEEFANFEQRRFKLFLFDDEENLRKKIRLQLLE